MVKAVCLGFFLFFNCYPLLHFLTIFYHYSCRHPIYNSGFQNSGAGAGGARPTKAASIFVGGMNADIAIQPTSTPSEGSVFQYPSPRVQLGVGVGLDLPE